MENEQYWLDAAVDPQSNHILHIRLYAGRTTALMEMFIRELKQKHGAEDALFLVDGAPWLYKACERHGLRFQHEIHGNRNAVERVYSEVKRRSCSFSNTFRHVEPETAENWLLAHARWHNSLN